MVSSTREASEASEGTLQLGTADEHHAVHGAGDLVHRLQHGLHFGLGERTSGGRVDAGGRRAERGRNREVRLRAAVDPAAETAGAVRSGAGLLLAVAVGADGGLNVTLQLDKTLGNGVCK